MEIDKISIVGFGNVGQSIADRLYRKRIGRDIVCVGNPDGDTANLESRVDELRHSAQGSGPSFIKSIDPSDIKDSHFVIMAAGSPRRTEQAREDLAKSNGKIVAEWAGYIKKYAPESLVVMVTNPVDAMTWVMVEKTGFNRERVLGVGGALDARRIITGISEELGLTGNGMTGVVLGAHSSGEDEKGNPYMIIPLESFTIGGDNLENYSIAVGKHDEYLRVLSTIGKYRKASQPLLAGLHQSPSLGPAEYVSRLTEALWFGGPGCTTGITTTAYVHLNGTDAEYGINGVLGVPVVVGRCGLIKVVNLPSLTPEHRYQLGPAAKHIADVTNIALSDLK